MSRLPSWVIVAAVGIVLVLAAADAIRPTTEESASKSSTKTSSPTTSSPGLPGVIVLGPNCKSLKAIRLQGLSEIQIPEQTDCDGLVWSNDRSLYASCIGADTVVGTSDGLRRARLPGCAPAWREDGALGIVRAGSLIVARTHGHPVELLSRRALGKQLRGVVERPETYRLTQISWIGLNRFAALVHGAQPWEEALVVFSTTGRLEQALTQNGAGIADLRVSPQGDYLAFARTALGRRFVITGIDTTTNVLLPRIGNALNVAWSPDETRVAISTRDTTYVAKPGAKHPILEIPFGGRYLTWLP
jgi:hypothetical protein